MGAGGGVKKYTVCVKIEWNKLVNRVANIACLRELGNQLLT